MTTIAENKIELDKQELLEFADGREARLAEIESEIKLHEYIIGGLLQCVYEEQLWIDRYASFERFCFLRCRR